MARPEQEVAALPGILRKRGYATLASHAHAPGFWNARERRERYGFDEQLFAADLGPGERVGLGLVDGEMLRRTAPRLTVLPRPWLGWLVTLTMHAPHPRVPSSFPRPALGPLEGTQTGNYLRKVRHTDDALRELVSTLDAAGVLDSTLVVVYGDHSELRGLDLGWVEGRTGVGGLPPDVRRLLLDRVALVMVPPASWNGDGVGHSVEKPGGLLDIAPTVLHLLGVARPRPFMGRSLLGPEPGLVRSWRCRGSSRVSASARRWLGRGRPRGRRIPRPGAFWIRPA